MPVPSAEQKALMAKLKDEIANLQKSLSQPAGAALEKEMAAKESAYRSFREKRPLEGIGHLLVWILLASVAFASTMAAPRHVIDVLVGLSFAVWAPVTWVSLKRKMR